MNLPPQQPRTSPCIKPRALRLRTTKVPPPCPTYYSQPSQRPPLHTRNPSLVAEIEGGGAVEMEREVAGPLGLECQGRENEGGRGGVGVGDVVGEKFLVEHVGEDLGGGSEVERREWFC